ncbi:unnamed protein product, partial [Didymodactylos carnosus]
VIHIWNAVSSHIENYMKQSKGVSIPGFGTFSFIHKRTDVGNNKYLLVQRPVFAISEKFAQTHGLKFTKYPINGSIPIHPLNYFAIQNQYSYSRDQIEQCVKHVLQVFNRSVAAQRNVEFTFTRIGKLQIRDGKVKMRFFKDFVNDVDGSGKVLEEIYSRPQTSDSVTPERDIKRPTSTSLCVLPRLNSRTGNPAMTSIEEEHDDNEKSRQSKKQQPQVTQRDLSPFKSDLNRSYTKQSDFHLPPLLPSSKDLFQSNKKTPPSSSPAVVRQSNERRSPTTNMDNEQQQQQQYETSGSRLAHYALPSNVVRATSDASALVGYNSRPSSKLNRERISSSMHITQHQSNSKPPTPSTPTCGHHGAGQELCYLCHQRAKRNIPVYMTEEKKVRQAEEEQLLQQYKHNQEMEEFKQREVKLKSDREEKQKVAAFNLGVAEAARIRKMERPSTTDVPRSFVFRKRAKTPPTYIRQQDLANHLEAQIKWKQQEETSRKQDKDFIERMEQIQLAEQLASEREAFIRNKRLKQEEMKNALDTQIRTKPVGLPVSESDGPIFGMNDMTTNKLIERRKNATETFKHQKEIVEQRQREQLLKQLREQEYEAHALDVMKDDLLSERRDRFLRSYTIRKDLENQWSNAVEEKRKRDLDEQKHVYAPQGILVHEQCDQYKRCAQCQRKLNNYGETNIWKETRYLSGARIMV